MHEFAKINNCAKRPIDIWTNYFYYFFSLRFVYLIRRTKISPNSITLFSLFLTLLGAAGFMTGSRFYILLGLFLVQISYIFDCADGQLARYRQQFSPFGGWMDQVADRLKEFIIYFSLAFGYAKMHPEQSHIWAWAMSALFFLYLLEYLDQIGKQYFASNKAGKKSVAATQAAATSKVPARETVTAEKPLFLIKLKSVRGFFPFHTFIIGEQYATMLFFILFDQTYAFFVFVTYMGLAMSIYRPAIQFLKLRNASLR